MKRKNSVWLFLSCAALFSGPFAQAEEKIFRCGNEYTNNATEAKNRGCKLVEGGNVTVVAGTKVPAPVKVAAAPAAARNDSSEQRARDAEARQILEIELKKAESRLAELQKEYNGGEPDKLGPETRNYQKYLDRVAELKANIGRYESDVSGLKRELARLPAANSAATAPAPNTAVR
ncbi:MAG: hypothetical protein ACKVOO_05345 [Burkholderiaceae bacterium]